MEGDKSSGNSEDPYPPGIEGPRVEIPSVNRFDVDTPSISAGKLGDSKTASLFVLQVILWNAVLLALSLGVMLIHFRDNWATGGQLVVAAVVLAAYGIYRLPDSDSE